jgi:hypothetical protein
MQPLTLGSAPCLLTAFTTLFEKAGHTIFRGTITPGAHRGVVNVNKEIETSKVIIES